MTAEGVECAATAENAPVASPYLPTRTACPGESLPPRYGMGYAVYILASRKHGTLYVGVTNDLARRVWEHREKHHRSFTSRYGVTRLVYAEFHDSIAEAIHREKRIKKWTRAMKVRLIEQENPEWHDLMQH